MEASGIPTKFPIPWGNSAGGSYIRAIPEASQIGITNGAASLTDGFPPNCFIPVASGGAPPFGQDFNGILQQITQWLQWAQAGAPITYDATFQSEIGGYPQGAVVASATTAQLWWLSTADNNTTNPDTGGAGWTAAFAKASAIAGSTRNLTMLVSSASATATITADEVAVCAALGALSWKLGSFNRTINLATTGAGGMDTGSAPTSGFVAIYAIYNPVSGASALLATNSTSSVAPTIYAGGSMPSGYTASALVSVWPTTSGGLLAAAVQYDRSVYGLGITLLTSTTAQSSRTVLTSASIPPNAKRIRGAISSFVNTAGALSLINLYPVSTASFAGAASQSSCPGAAGATQATPFEMSMVTPQTIYYTAGVSGTGTAFTYSLGFVGYDF
jgi:hypothetical protein